MKWVATLAAVLAGCGADADCTLIGCTSKVTLGIGAFPESDFAPPYARLDVCLNGACANTTLDALPGQEPIVVEVATLQDPKIAATLSRTTSQQIDIVISVTAHDGVIFNDGDLYRATVTSSDGRVIADVSRAVTYDTRYPNGPDCSPTCRTADY